MSAQVPPRLLTSLLERLADPATRDAQIGDLIEEFEERSAEDPRSARAWYRSQVIRSIGPNLGVRLKNWRSDRRNQRRGDGAMWRLGEDVRLAVRSFVKHAAFNAAIVLTVALGIGAITTTYSVVHGLVLAPFSFPEPDRIVGVGTAYPRLGVGLGYVENMSPAEYMDIRDNSETLEDVVAWDMGNRQIDTDGPPQNVLSAFWWGNALETVQMDAYLGRGFSDDEVATGANVILLSHSAWLTRFGADSSLVGSGMSVNDNPYTLIGIIPDGVDFYGTDLWMTMPVGPEVFPRNRRQFQTLGRVRASSTVDEVNAELAVLAARTDAEYRAEHEEYEGWSMVAQTWNDVSSQRFRGGVFVLFGAVSFVLLLVCANTASLLLARAQGRRREMAVRTALGAGRARLVAQMLTESVTLAAVAGIIGVGLAFLGVRGVNNFTEAVGLGVLGAVELNLPVFTFTALATVGCGILFGLAPALYAGGAGVQTTLKNEATASTATISRQRLQRTLVGIEVALAFVLLAGGGLLINSMVRVTQVEPGFDTENLLTMRLTLPREKYSADEVPAFFRELTERVEALPGIEQAGAGTQYPGVAFSFEQIYFDGPGFDADATLPTTLATIVSSGYFESLGIPLVAGRTFAPQDRGDAPLVAVLNEVAAERYFPGQNPIGQRLKVGNSNPETPWWEIVGVVGATTNLGLDAEPFPEVFAVHEQVGGGQNQLFLLLRTSGEPVESVAAVRDVVLAMDPDQPVYAIRTAEETFQAGIAPMRATTLFLSIFGAFALTLAVVGIYAVVSFTVSERTQEIGLRVALGADQSRVRALVVRQALAPVIIGALAGVAGSFAVRGGLEQLLFDVGAGDPVTLGLSALVLIGAAAAASWLPARRAARLDPVVALRTE